MRIAVAQFMHETVTFLRNDTVREDFIYPGSPLSGEALLQSGRASYMGGFVKAAREYSEVQLIGITSPMFPKTSIGSGWITADAFEYFMRIILDELLNAGTLEGVYLALHGAMGVRGIARPEAEIARRIREALGPHVWIAATFDPHGNEDETFLEYANLAFSCKYFPHYDEYLQGSRAARMLVRAIRKDYRPAHATRRVPILTPTVMQCTDGGPWAALVQRALIWEARSPDLYINVFFGFPWNDAIDAGMTIQATANGDPALAERAAQDMAQAAWRMRAELVAAVKVHSIDEGLAYARTLTPKPVIIADYSDRSGRATWVLAQLQPRALSRVLIATITDAALVQRMCASGVKPGDRIEAEIGGGEEPSDGQPVRIEGTIRVIASMTQAPGFEGNSPWIVIELGRDNVLIVSPLLAQIIDPGTLSAHVGLDPAAFDYIVLKSRAHFRRGFIDGGFAQHAVLVHPDAPFLGTVWLQALPYSQLRLQDYYPYGKE